MAGLSAIGGVLAQRNARIFSSGSIVCWTGSWIQRIATDWLAWELTHSALWVAIIAFCNLAPSVIVSPIAGAVADRMDRVHLTMASQFITVAQAVILVTLILTGLIRVEYMAVLTLCNGAAETFAQPARQCLIPGLVPRSHLAGAVALNSLTYNAARFVGPAISGPMIALWGVVPSICVNAVAFLYASLSMYLLRLDPAVRRGKPTGFSVMHDALDGIRYVAKHRGIGPLMLFAAVVGMTLRSIPEMLPPYVADRRGLRTDPGRRHGGLCRHACVRGRGCLHGRHGRGDDHARDFLSDAAAELHRARDDRAGAQHMGDDHPGGAGDGRADVWNRVRVFGPAHSGPDRRCGLHPGLAAYLETTGAYDAYPGRGRFGSVSRRASPLTAHRRIKR